MLSRYVKMTLVEIKDQGRGGHVWSFNGDHNFGMYDEYIYRKVSVDGVYHSTNKGFILNSYIIFDLENESVKKSLKDNNGGFVRILNEFIREHKINNILNDK